MMVTRKTTFSFLVLTLGLVYVIATALHLHVSQDSPSFAQSREFRPGYGDESPKKSYALPIIAANRKQTGLFSPAHSRKVTATDLETAMFGRQNGSEAGHNKTGHTRTITVEQASQKIANFFTGVGNLAQETKWETTHSGNDVHKAEGENNRTSGNSQTRRAEGSRTGNVTLLPETEMTSTSVTQKPEEENSEVRTILVSVLVPLGVGLAVFGAMVLWIKLQKRQAREQCDSHRPPPSMIYSELVAMDPMWMY